MKSTTEKRCLSREDGCLRKVRHHHLATAYRQVVRLHQRAHACRCNYGPFDGKCEEN